MSLPMQQAALARYGAVKVTTSSPGQLLVMLYDGLLRYLRDAHAAMTARQRARAGERIGRAQAVLRELLGTLDPTHAPLLCERLQAVYLFCGSHLLRANLEQNADKILEVTNILTPLRDAWAEAVKLAAAAK